MYLNRVRQLFVFFILGLATSSLPAQQQNARQYPLGPDSQVQSNVPQGTISTHTLLDCKSFPGTVRRYYVYVPKQYDARKPAALMVFQDGHAYVNKTGQYRAPVVFDNLIHSGEIPVTIGVFVDPGHRKEKLPPKPGWRPTPENRSVEYDTLSDQYSKLILDEILPEVKKKYNISNDPAMRASCGASSGGICAFTLAWQRPDQFGKVISHIGSFTNIRHGDTYPGLIRAADKKPIRVYLQDGSNDLDNRFGNWPLANQQMYAALNFKKYDVKFDYGEGAHNGNHGGSLFPYALRWLWRDVEGVQPILALIPEDRKQAWWQNRYEMKLYQRKAMRNKVDLLMVGDSITHSWENGGKAVFEKYYAHRKTLNIGFSGDRTEHVIWRIQNGAVDDIQPKLAVIMIGTNNTGHRREKAAHTARGVERIIDELNLRSPNTKILLLGVFPRGATQDHPMRKINVEINEIISGLSERKNVWYIDLSEKFLDSDGNLPKEIMPDSLHPNQKGYKIWAATIEPTIKKLLGE